jgi:hypothetical protein
LRYEAYRKGQATITEKPIPTKRFVGIWCEILQGLGARGRLEIGENGLAMILRKRVMRGERDERWRRKKKKKIK